MHLSTSIWDHLPRTALSPFPPVENPSNPQKCGGRKVAFFRPDCHATFVDNHLLARGGNSWPV